MYLDQTVQPLCFESAEGFGNYGQKESWEVGSYAISFRQITLHRYGILIGNQRSNAP